MAGLTAAWELARSRPKESTQVILFEASARLGGIVETVHEGGFVIECGPDGWVTEKPWARELAEELGLGDEIISSNDLQRKTYILVNGRLVAIPDGMRMMVPKNLECIDSSELFSESAKKYFHLELARAKELKAAAPDADESVASFVQRHFGSEVVEKIGAPLLGGVFGGDASTLSARAVMAPYVAMEREHGSLIRALQLKDKKTQHTVFTSLKNGLGTLIDRLVQAIPAGWIRLNEAVRSLAYGDEGWLVGTAHGAERFDAVLMAAPVDAARALFAPVDARMAGLMEMDSSSAVVVAFGFPDARQVPVPPGFGFLVPRGSGSHLLAATFVDQKYSHRVPEGGRLLRAFFGGDEAERMMQYGNDEIAAVARGELARILGSLPEPQVSVVRRLPRSLPQYAVGHLERMAELDARVGTLPGLWLLGNGYRGVGLPDLIRDARAAARAVWGVSPSARHAGR